MGEPQPRLRDIFPLQHLMSGHFAQAAHSLAIAEQCLGDDLSAVIMHITLRMLFNTWGIVSQVVWTPSFVLAPHVFADYLVLTTQLHSINHLSDLHMMELCSRRFNLISASSVPADFNRVVALAEIIDKLHNFISDHQRM